LWHTAAVGYAAAVRPQSGCEAERSRRCFGRERCLARFAAPKAYCHAVFTGTDTSFRRIVDLTWNLGLDELRQQGQRFIPAEIASLGGDDGTHTFLNNAHRITAALNDRGVRTARGGRWTRVQVGMILARA
jgi:hypothetical protein